MNKKLSIFSRFWIPAILWMAVIFFLSSIPGKDIPKVPIPHFHKIVHFIEYAILGMLLMRALLYSNLNVNSFRLSIASVIIIIFFAFFDEWHQTFVPDRSGEFEDVLSDTIYSIVGVCLYNGAGYSLLKKRR